MKDLACLIAQTIVLMMIKWSETKWRNKLRASEKGNFFASNAPSERNELPEDKISSVSTSSPLFAICFFEEEEKKPRNKKSRAEVLKTKQKLHKGFFRSHPTLTNTLSSDASGSQKKYKNKVLSSHSYGFIRHQWSWFCCCSPFWAGKEKFCVFHRCHGTRNAKATENLRGNLSICRRLLRRRGQQLQGENVYEKNRIFGNQQNNINQLKRQMRSNEFIQLILLIVMESSLSWLRLAVDSIKFEHTRKSLLRSSGRWSSAVGRFYWFGVVAHVACWILKSRWSGLRVNFKGNFCSTTCASKLALMMISFTHEKGQQQNVLCGNHKHLWMFKRKFQCGFRVLKMWKRHDVTQSLQFSNLPPISQILSS